MQNCNSKFKCNLQERCYKFSLDIIKLADILPNKRSSRVITNQLIRSGTSIGANLVESKASSSRLEFKKFHEISLKSANESKYWLKLIHDAKLVKSENVVKLLSEVDELAKMIAAGILTLKGKR